MFTVGKRNTVRMISRNDTMNTPPVMENTTNSKIVSRLVISNEVQWAVSRLLKGLFGLGAEEGFIVDQVAISVAEILNKEEHDFISSLVGPGYIAWTGVQSEKIIAIFDKKSKDVPLLDVLIEKSNMLYKQ